MKNKKVFIIIAIIVLLAFGGIVGYNAIRTNLGNYLFTRDGKIVDDHSELIEHLKGIEDKTERKKQVDFALQQNLITQDEANEIY